ncbi:MAG: heavy-metal-associated domain-containing protein [Gammaproteobacteria bacterium]|nr:heavy-metal-associated domain-containing protein [Gammaproteobacteria bacterium]
MKDRIRTLATLSILLTALLFIPPLFGGAAAAEEQSVYALQVDGLACPFCAYGLEKQLTRIDGVETMSTDIKSGTMTIIMQSGKSLAESAAQAAVDRAGFSMRAFKRQQAIQ